MTKRRAAIKYSDKRRVERFREYATHEFDKRDMDAALNDLIGGTWLLMLPPGIVVAVSVLDDPPTLRR